MEGEEGNGKDKRKHIKIANNLTYFNFITNPFKYSTSRI